MAFVENETVLSSYGKNYLKSEIPHGYLSDVSNNFCINE